MIETLIFLSLCTILPLSWESVCFCLSFFLLFVYFSMDGVVVMSNFYCDNLSWVLCLLSLLVSVMFMFTCKRSLESKVFMGITFFSVILFFSSNNFGLLFISFELSLIPVFFLILMMSVSPERVKASKFMIIYTLFASFPLIISFLVSQNFLNSWTFLPFLFPVCSEKPSSILLVCFFLAFLVKTPMFFLHSWLTKAHVEAPFVGSMILAGVALKMGVFGFIRLSSFFTPWSDGVVVLISISILGSVLAAFMALSSDDVKMAVAYASVSHMNLCLTSILSLKMVAIKASILVLFAHGLCSSGLFFLVTSLYLSSGSRSMVVSKGLFSMFPSVALFGFVLWAANLAAPPSVSFYAEVLTLVSIFSISAVILLVALLFVAVNSFFSMVNWGLAFHSFSPLSSKSNISPASISVLVAFSFPLLLLFFFLDTLVWN